MPSSPSNKPSQTSVSKGHEAKMQQRLEEVSARIDKLSPNAEKNLPKGSHLDTNRPASGRALQIGSDLLGGVVVGGLIGYAMDVWFATRPVCFLIFLMLGIMAGLLNVLRSARLMQREQEELVRRGQLDMGQDLPERDEDD